MASRFNSFALGLTAIALGFVGWFAWSGAVFMIVLNIAGHRPPLLWWEIALIPAGMVAHLSGIVIGDSLGWRTNG